MKKKQQPQKSDTSKADAGKTLKADTAGAATEGNLGLCHELQRLLAGRGKIVSVQRLAELSSVSRTNLRAWCDESPATPLPSALAKLITSGDGNASDTTAAAAAGSNGTMSKLHQAYIAIDEQIVALAPQVRAAEIAVDDAKKSLAQQRKEYEKMVKQLTALNMKLVDAKNGQLQPDLPLDFGSDAELRAGAEKPKGTPALAQVKADMDALRAQSRNGFNLTAPIIAQLTRAKIKTIGDLKDRLADCEQRFGSKDYERIFKFIGDFPVMREPVKDDGGGKRAPKK
jgi:uncharacterized coiled-coil protein SlyX